MSGSQTCSEMSNLLLHMALGSTSWDAVTCDQITAARLAPDWGSYGSGSGSGSGSSPSAPLTEILADMMAACCGADFNSMAAVGQGGRVETPSPSRSITETACPNDVSSLPSVAEACEAPGFTNRTTCESVGCCWWDSARGECYSNGPPSSPCAGCEACGCADDQQCDWSYSNGRYQPACYTRCSEDEDRINGQCVSRCADGGVSKKISAEPSEATSVSEPAVTVAAPSSVPTMSEPTIIPCPGLAGAASYESCGCDYQTDGHAQWIDNEYKCVKCPGYSLYGWMGNEPKCVLCPRDESIVWTDPPQCYKYAHDISSATFPSWQVMKCDDNGAQTDAVATGDAPTLVAQVLTECLPLSWDTDTCNTCLDSGQDYCYSTNSCVLRGANMCAGPCDQVTGDLTSGDSIAGIVSTSCDAPPDPNCHTCLCDSNDQQFPVYIGGEGEHK